MSTTSATDLLSKPRHMAEYGNAVVAEGNAAPTNTLAADDVIRPCIIPAGSEVCAIMIANTDLDSDASPAILCRIGYTPVSSDDGSLQADDDYFAAAGQTILQAANDGKLYMKFAPKKFEQDVFLDITINTAAATKAAGTVYAVVLGKAAGIK